MIRPARPEDKASVVSFNHVATPWGDYGADRFDNWMEDPAGIVVVAANESDSAIAVSFITMLSSTEAWFEIAGVRADVGCRGIAEAIVDFGTTWARAQGAMVVRLAVEQANTSGPSEVADIGFRAKTEWVRASRPVGESSPLPSGNGGRRVPAQEQLVPAPSSEALAAFMSWGSGPLARPSRGLFAVRLRCRRLTDRDVRRAARRDALWMARSGWAIAAPDRDEFEVSWVETREEDATDLMRALADLATKLDTESINMTFPNVCWLTDAARQAGNQLDRFSVYERSL